MSRARKRVFYQVYSRRDEVIELTPESTEEVRKFACGRCFTPSLEWDANPVPINIVVDEEPRGCKAGIGSASHCPTSDILREELYDMIEPYLVGMEIGSVRVVEGEDAEPRWIPYVTSAVPRRLALEADRGRYCRHHQCKFCGRLFNKVLWASGAIVERYLDDRLVYLDNRGDWFIDGDLAKRLDLRARIPDIRLYRFDVIPEPLDGDVLPGDPGWKGKFRERPSAEPPRTEPPRGRWTTD